MWISLSTVSGTFRRARATCSHSRPVMWLLNSKQSKATLLGQKSSSKLIHPFPPTNFSKEIMKFFTIYQTNFTNPPAVHAFCDCLHLIAWLASPLFLLNVGDFFPGKEATWLLQMFSSVHHFLLSPFSFPLGWDITSLFWQLKGTLIVRVF